MVPKRLPPLPDVDAEWQRLDRCDPEARTHAVALRQRRRELWPDREPTTDELFSDEVCFHHLLWLQAARPGGLAAWLSTALSDR